MDIDTAAKVGFGLAILFCIYRAIGRVDDEVQSEMARNERDGPLSSAQTSWLIRHIRNDIKLVCYLLGGIMVMLFWIGLMMAAGWTK